MIKRLIFPSPQIPQIPQIREKTIVDEILDEYGKYHQRNTKDRLYFYSDAYDAVQGMIIVDGYDSNRIRIKADVDQPGFLGHVVAIKEKQFIKKVRLYDRTEFSFSNPDLVIIYLYDMSYYVDINTEIALIPQMIEVDFMSDNSVVKKVLIDGVALNAFSEDGYTYSRWYDGYVFVYPSREDTWGFIEFTNDDMDAVCIAAYDSRDYVNGNILASKCSKGQVCTLVLPKEAKLVVAYSYLLMATQWGTPYHFGCNVLPDTSFEPSVTRRLIRW